MPDGEALSFSVVIPLYNKAPHIAASVRSALAQTLPPKEVLVVDDASTDGGLEIVRGMDDSRIRIFSRVTPGPGGYAARNLGIGKATSEWIAFLDADDVWMPEHLADLSDSIGRCEEPVITAFSRACIIQGDERRDYPISGNLLKANQPLDAKAVLRAWLDRQYCPLWTGAIAAKRSALISAGLFPEGRARRGGDKDMWLRLITTGLSVYSDKITAEFRQDTVNRVSNSTAHSELPIVTSTIKDMLPSVDAETGALLRKLSNQEIRLYAKRSVAAGAGVSASFLPRLYLPEGMMDLSYLLALMALSVPYQWIGGRRKTA